MRQQSSKGFTLVELIIVVAIIGIMAAAGFSIDFAGWRYRAGLREVYGALQNTRLNAVRTNISQTIRIQTNSKGYSMAQWVDVIYLSNGTVNTSTVGTPGIQYQDGNLGPTDAGGCDTFIFLRPENPAAAGSVSVCAAGHVRVTL